MKTFSQPELEAAGVLFVPVRTLNIALATAGLISSKIAVPREAYVLRKPRVITVAFPPRIREIKHGTAIGKTETKGTA